ncbi:hypothetical protein BKH43_06045 [Helicobacter sp. 13S00401-1]|uniref:DUF1440 domain-containing protein n=1 Tax=Helicobacter sp. 13S00401-1 TaxID=1905758 RepID=UPI000BA58833|nr:DUF1440 domain-containing protein [Helicobacter sp. 13S00401-1]PAF50052.1 hypothetical protein BKH43_06045 [Helicobacter sp. 13S00401-1]
MYNLFRSSLKSERNYKAIFWMAVFIALISPIIKSGTESVFPPWGPDVIAPPPFLVMDYWGFSAPLWRVNGGNAMPAGWLLHVFLSFVVIFVYIYLVERFPRLTLWHGIAMGVFLTFLLHYIMVPAMGAMPSLFGPDVWKTAPWHLNWVTNLNELIDHVLWMWVCEEMRAGMRAKKLGLPTPMLG